jgi:D-arabinose 1-dehydrogenase-like Zn-dependent alcohol dehydrogenase
METPMLQALVLAVVAFAAMGTSQTTPPKLEKEVQAALVALYPRSPGAEALGARAKAILVFPNVHLAALVRAFKQPLAIEEVSVTAAGAGQILIKIAASGVCQTDLHAADGDWPEKPRPPFVLAQEGVGHVAAVGAEVSHIREGDRLGFFWLYTAFGHRCNYLGGRETLGEPQQNTGCLVNGGFAEYFVADANYVGHLPSNESFVEIAPILCAGVTDYKGLKVTDTHPGDWVVLSGIATASGIRRCSRQERWAST